MGILVLLAFYARWRPNPSSAPDVGRWAPLLREGLLFGSYKDHHTRSVGLEHPVETFRFVRTEAGGVATVGSGSGRNEYIVRPDGVLQHVHAEGITAELRGEGEDAEFVWSHGYKSAAFSSDKPPKVEVPDCTLVKAHAAESVKLLPEVAQALRAGRTTPLLLASPPGYAIVPKTDEPQRIDEWGVNYQQLGIGPASEALQAKMRGKFLLSQHHATRDYVLDVPFATYKVHCEGEHGKLPLAVISWDDRSRNLDADAPRTFVVNADNSISPTKATHLAFGMRGVLPLLGSAEARGVLGAQMAELKLQAGGKPTVEDADLDLGSTPSHGNPRSTNDLNSELNNVARNTDDTARARALVKAGADLRSTNGPTWRHTPLHQAAYHGRYEMAKTLVELGAPLDLHSNPCGRGATGTPLELARGGGHHQIADMLEKAAGGKKGRVARLLSNLLQRINPRVAQLAPPVAKTSSVEGRWEVYQNIDMAYQGDVEIIDDWRSHTSIDELKTIVEEKGYSAISVGSFGFAALKSFDYQLTKEHCKPSHGYTNELHIWFPSVRGSRPLPSGEAAKPPKVPAGFHFHEGFGEATRGDQIGHITSGGVESHCFKGDKLRWPLQWAAMIGDVEAIDALVAAGHDPNVKMSDWYDSEPLGWAASFGQCKAIEALCAHGADPGRPANLAGNTPLSDAQREGHTEAIALLNEYLSGARTIGPPLKDFATVCIASGV